jgi:hypothetical protein
VSKDKFSFFILEKFGLLLLLLIYSSNFKSSFLCFLSILLLLLLLLLKLNDVFVIGVAFEELSIDLEVGDEFDGLSCIFSPDNFGATVKFERLFGQ